MNGFERIKKIGEGAFGKAYLMKNKSTGAQVVVKETCLSKLPPKEREDARRETAVLAQLKHTSVVSYHDSFEECGNLYIVMDYCDGGDLAVKINNQRGRLFAEHDILDWITQLCLAVKHIHDRNILHRDIKCQNIFLTKSGQIKLGDFGIAKILDSTIQLSHTMIGTPYYFSPEICMGRPYNHKSDIWSLGCVFYELATLRHAFDGNNLRAVMQKIQNGTPTPISRTFSPELTLFIMSILKKNPRDRPSVHTLLKRPIISKRISKFLSEEEYNAEFSHTVLHGERLLKKIPKGGPASKAAAGRARPQTAAGPSQRPYQGVGQRPNQQRRPSTASNERSPPSVAQRPSTASNERAPVLTPQQPVDQNAAVESPQHRVPAFRPAPMPAKAPERGDYKSYLDFLRNLDIRRRQQQQANNQIPMQVPHPVQPASARQQLPVQQTPVQAPQPFSARPNPPQPGKIEVVNPSAAQQIFGKRPSSANAAVGRVGSRQEPPRGAFVRPMKNVPPKVTPNANPVVRKNRENFVADRLNQVRQQNIRQQNMNGAKRMPFAMRPSSASNNRNLGLKAENKPLVNQRFSSQQDLNNLTNALRIVQVPGLPASPRVPSSVAPSVTPRLTDALKAVQVKEDLPIDHDQLRKLRQQELLKANKNKPIIIGDRPFWKADRQYSEDLGSLVPEMTGSGMVDTVFDENQSKKKNWEDEQDKESSMESLQATLKNSHKNPTFTRTRKRSSRPSWNASSHDIVAQELKKHTLSSLTPSELKESVALKLATGQFDITDRNLLRTCSLPSLTADDDVAISPAASTVSTLEFLKTAGSTTSIWDMVGTMGLSCSSPDLRILNSTTAKVVCLNDDEEIETIRLDQSVSEKQEEEPGKRAKIAWNASSIVSSSKKPDTQGKPPNPKSKVTESMLEIDSDVDDVSKSMMDLLSAPPSNLLIKEPAKANHVIDKELSPIDSLISQMKNQNVASKQSSSNNGTMLNDEDNHDEDDDSADVPKILEELEKLTGADTSPLPPSIGVGKDGTVSSGTGSTAEQMTPIEALVKSNAFLMDTIAYE